jgi:hypothetical protein
MSKTPLHSILPAQVTTLYFSSSLALYKDNYGVVHISDKITSFQSKAILVLFHNRNGKVYYSSCIYRSYFPDASVDFLNSSLSLMQIYCRHKSTVGMNY